jgi:predicted HAD superfamily Cof-like phosphohydrolase
MTEELVETIDAMKAQAMCVIETGHEDEKVRTDVLKELCDLQYVLSGTIHDLGYENFDVAFNRVHKSNMKKLEGATFVDGKLQKGENYQPPELGDLI